MFSNLTRVGACAVALVLLSACGGAATPTAAPTPAPKPTTAPAQPTAPQPTAPQPTAPQPTAGPKPTAVAQAPAATAVSAATAAPAATAAQTTGAKGGALKIDTTQSEATFSLGEKLFGQPNTVIGKSNKVSGDVAVDFDNPGNSKIGPIQIDAREFKTDNNQRNNMIQRFILQSGQDANQFITFEPTKIEGLAGKVAMGQAATFKVTGNLKIRNISKPVTFDVTVTPKSDTELSGNAKAVVTRAAFDLQIPQVPSVADVTDEVTLEFKFVAKP